MSTAEEAEAAGSAAEGREVPGRPIGPLSAGVATLCGEVLTDVRDPAVRLSLGEVRARLAEPLRIAIAGSVSSGKSTLVNALLGRAVAPVDASDCTKVVTWFRYGFPERVEIIASGGARRVVPLGTGETLAVAAGDLDAGSSLVVWLSNERLRDLTLIDTPGLDSIDPTRERATEELLGLESSSRAAVAAADALILLMPLARRFDGELLERFHSLYLGTGLSAVNAAGVISKVDRLVAPCEDPWPVARELAERAEADLALTVADVAPVAGLLASTAVTGALTEADARALDALAKLGPAALEDALLTPADLLAADVPVPEAHRRRLVELLDLYGIWVGARAASGGASAVLTALREASGLTGLVRLIQDCFARRADALKAHVAACDLDRLSYLASDPDDEQALRRLRDPLDRLASEPEFHELRVLEVVRSVTDGTLKLPEDLAADLERIARHSDAAGRLGLEPGASPNSMSAAAAEAASRWARWSNDPRRSSRERGAARDVKTSYEWIWDAANRGVESVGEGPSDGE
jgi:hypothetical protein